MNRLHKIQSKNVNINCVIPIHNEEAVIEKFIKQLVEYLKSITNTFELLIVNDGSQDNTREIVEGLVPSYPIKLINFSRNFGKEMAISAGLEYANSDVAIIIDADFQHPFETIYAFLMAWSTGYDMVYGLRQSRHDESRVKRFCAQAFYNLMSKISNTDIPINAGDFRLLDRKVIDAIGLTQERERFMKGLYSWVGFKSKGIPFEVQERAGGKTSWNFLKLFDLAISGIVSFSDTPLRLWSLIGVIVSIFSFLSITYIIFDTLILGVKVPGYATLLSAITFFGGIQLLSIGVLGEYVARIFNEVKKRPKYIIESIKQQSNSD